MATYSIKTELELKKELDEKPKEDIIQYALYIRNELQKCYDSIGELSKEINHQKNINLKLGELLLQQTKVFTTSKDFEVEIIKLKAKEQIKSFIDSNKFL